MRKHLIARIVGIIVAILLAVSIVGYLYLSDYYHADQKALSYLVPSAENVSADSTNARNTAAETGTSDRSDTETMAAGEEPSDRGSVMISEIDKGLFLDGPGTENALIFYPGGKVEYTAYLPLLHRIASEGLDCFLTAMPGNLAILDMDRADDIMASYSYDHWYLGGHSLGGAVAAMYAAKAEVPPEGLFLLAAYPTKQLPDIRVLELYGSEDQVLNREKLEKTAKYLPADATVMEIPGGNHAQFGDYGMQDGDGMASIPAEVQQEITKEMILKQLNP